MKRYGTLPVIMAASVVAAAAYNIIWLNTTDYLSIGVQPTTDLEIAYADGTDNVAARNSKGVIGKVATAQLKDITFGTSDGTPTVRLADGNNCIQYPEYFSIASMPFTYEIDQTTGTVIIRSAEGIQSLDIAIAGKTSQGQVKIYSSVPVNLTLNSAEITNANGPAINIQAAKGNDVTVTLKGDSKICDGAFYTTTPEGEKEKGALYSTTSLIFNGTGSLSATGLYKHAVVAEKALTINGGTIQISQAFSDGIHCSAFTMNGGKYTSANTQGDGIDADTGTAVFNGGEVEINISETDIKGVSADESIEVNGGKITVVSSSDQGKAFKTKGKMTVNGGEIVANITGEVVITDGEPSYPTAIKTGTDFEITDGTITVNHSGDGGKGISTDGMAIFKGGVITITNTGNGVVYKDASGNYDTATPASVTTDGDLQVLGGTLTLKNSGSAGKCLKSDTKIIIGETGTDGPTIYAEATGARISETASSVNIIAKGPGGGNWGPGGGGFDQNGDYANPKGIKAQTELIVNSGNITVKGTQTGGEGMESKGTITINGGTMDISTADDCINAATNITINGGFIHCNASNNDGIDSNGTITITGGTVITMGASSPEEGFDCDNNTFKITGGTLIGLGGSTSTPTSSVCTQRVVLYNASISNGKTYTVCDPNGNQVVSLKSPKSISGVLLISSPNITNNGTYTIYRDGTVSGGQTFFELTTDAEYTPGTSLKTFKPSSMVTNVR